MRQEQAHLEVAELLLDVLQLLLGLGSVLRVQALSPMHHSPGPCLIAQTGGKMGRSAFGG
jgi:hypothetical protein